MYHKKCTGKIEIDCTSMFVLRSPSIRVDSTGIFPGPIQIDSAKIKSSAKLVCHNCQETFTTKDEYEEGIVETCAICRDKYPPSQIRVVDGLSYVCQNCIDSKSSSKENKIAMYFGELIRNKDYPTLLTILMKK